MKRLDTIMVGEGKKVKGRGVLISRWILKYARGDTIQSSRGGSADVIKMKNDDLKHIAVIIKLISNAFTHMKSANLFNPIAFIRQNQKGM